MEQKNQQHKKQFTCLFDSTPQLRAKANWFERRAAVEKYNRDNKWRKRGF